MGKRLNLIGKKFNRLTVISFNSVINNKSMWNVICECGTEKVVSGTTLIRGLTKSCGCFQREKASKLCKNVGKEFGGKYNKLPEGEAGFNHIYREYSRAALKRGYPFNLSKEEARILFNSRCYYCGSELLNNMSKKSANGDFKYNGIDRVDNTKGYEPDNCVSCCWRCNDAKGNITFDMVKNLINHPSFKKWQKKMNPRK